MSGAGGYKGQKKRKSEEGSITSGITTSREARKKWSGDGGGRSTTLRVDPQSARKITSKGCATFERGGAHIKKSRRSPFEPDCRFKRSAADQTM